MPRPARVDPDEILAAAARVIAERGIVALRLADVAAAAGVSVGLIQYRFRTRDDLIAAALRHALRDGYARHAGALADGDDAWERLRAMLESIFVETPQMLERWRRWAMLTAALVRDPTLAAIVGDFHGRWAAPVARAIEDGVEAGTLRPLAPPRDAALALLALVDGLGFAALGGSLPLAEAGRIAERHAAGMLGVVEGRAVPDERLPTGALG